MYTIHKIYKTVSYPTNKKSLKDYYVARETVEILRGMF